MPVITALFALYMPKVETTFTYIVAGIFTINIMTFLIMLMVFNKKKRPNAARLTCLFNLLTFCLFFTFPFIKAFMGHLWLQLLLILFFFITLALAIYDQNQEVPLVFPDPDKGSRKYSLVFYAIPVVLLALGGGGNIIFTRILVDFFGDGFATFWGGGVLYGLGCWLAFLFQSLFNHGLQKNGVWVK